MTTVTGLTAERMLEIEAASVVAGVVEADGDLILTRHDGTMINAGNVYDVLGFVWLVQATPPTAAQITAANGRPIVWITEGSPLTPTPVAPTAPTFDLTSGAQTVTAPTLVGVQYRIIDGVNIIPLVGGVVTSVSGFTKPYNLKIEAVALPGYVLSGNYTWERQLIDVSNLTIYTSDSFAGTAGQILGTSATVSNRVFDQALGGAASPVPAWFGTGLKIMPDGVSASKNQDAGQDAAWGSSILNVGAYNFGWDLIVKSPFPVAHSRSMRMYIGALNGSQAVPPAIQLELYINGSQMEARFPASGTVAGQNVVLKTGLTEAVLLGTWKLTWVNKFLQVTMPTGETAGKDYSTSGVTYGQWLGIGVADYSAPGSKVWPTYDGVKIYR